jgi:hypothetical protein
MFFNGRYIGICNYVQDAPSLFTDRPRTTPAAKNAPSKSNSRRRESAGTELERTSTATVGQAEYSVVATLRRAGKAPDVLPRTLSSISTGERGETAAAMSERPNSAKRAGPASDAESAQHKPPAVRDAEPFWILRTENLEQVTRLHSWI